MSFITTLHKNNIPKEWFFFEPFDNNLRKFYDSYPHAGVIFFSKLGHYNNNFFLKIEPLAKFCTKKKIKFFIPLSSFWALRLKPNGMISFTTMSLANRLNLKFLKKNYWLATKVHNRIEAIKSSGFNFVFISPVFKTQTFPKKKPHNKMYFFLLCKILKKKIVLALGGVNKTNYKYLKNSNLFGFGGINNFSEYEK